LRLAAAHEFGGHRVTGHFPRRNFLAAGGILSGYLAAGSPFALFAPGRAWALDLRSLSSAQGATLLSVARTIAPHDTLEDAAYALVVQAIDEAAASDAHARTIVTTGLAQLGEDFAARGEAARVEALKAVESSEFFTWVRAKTLGTLYASPIAYAHFGYEGEAFSKGGYLTRGFDELRWLPDVPLEDSGPNPLHTER
jgi:phage-related tail fiber protein